MDLYNKPLDTNGLFVGGAGLFLQYFDVVKPIYLYATMSLVLGDNMGLPTDIIKNMTLSQIFEWYKQRRYINPLRSLDYMNKINPDDLDQLLKNILKDESLYRVTPLLNISVFLEVYHKQYMSFPFYIYTEEENPLVRKDIDQVFGSVPHHYVFGDLQEATKNCRENFTYIFSDVELLNNAATTLDGTYSHILLAEDYRYNSIGNIPKYDLKAIMARHPFIRTGTTQVMSFNVIGQSFQNICAGGER